MICYKNKVTAANLVLIFLKAIQKLCGSSTGNVLPA